MTVCFATVTAKGSIGLEHRKREPPRTTRSEASSVTALGVADNAAPAPHRPAPRNHRRRRAAKMQRRSLPMMPIPPLPECSARSTSSRTTPILGCTLGCFAYRPTLRSGQLLGRLLLDDGSEKRGGTGHLHPHVADGRGKSTRSAGCTEAPRREAHKVGSAAGAKKRSKCTRPTPAQALQLSTGGAGSRPITPLPEVVLVEEHRRVLLVQRDRR